MGKYDLGREWLSNEGASHAKILRSVKPGSVVLEFGPAGGLMTEYMQSELNCDVYIVELSEQDFSKAICFARDGVCGNASDLEWLDKFASIQFDYILFADILEHLYDPDVVLENAVSLLKDDGRVIISVPNIAHSSILINLLKNRFEYKEIGLLDKTHIRFFTYYSLLEMLDTAGLVAIVEDASYILPQNTEFKEDYDNTLGNIEVLRSKNFSNVYQFVFTAVKKGQQAEVRKLIEEPVNEYEATVYLDTGHGFKEEEKKTYRILSGDDTFYQEINLPPSTVAFRFDPVEGEFCIVKQLEIMSEGGYLEYVNVNGFSIGAYHFFTTRDPQFTVQLPHNNTWVTIDAKIYCINNPVLAGYLLCVEEQLAEKEVLTALLEEKARIIAEKDTELVATQNELATTQIQYQAIQNSFWWRITKPARFLAKGTKWILKHFPLTRAMYKSLYRLRYGSIDDSVKSDNDNTNPGNPEDTDIADWLSGNLLETNFPHGADYKYSGVIDIVVPVYNGFDYLETLLASIAKTEMHYRLYIVDDCSTDERVRPYLRNIAASQDNVILMENKTNLGFVKSVNRALKKAKNHVALLNTDIVLPDRWLERLMYPIIHMDKIASSTPFTNSGTICSFFNFGEDNPLFEGLSLEQIDRVFSKIKPSYIPLPTGVGFCMGMSKEAIKKIGSFDYKTFTRGYGEENDWCRRAIKAGFKNVLVDNLFVHHKHGGSFSEEDKLFQVTRNLELLNKKHPNYDAIIAHHFADNPARHIRNIVAMQLISANISTKQILIFNHGWGGGATMYLDRRIKAELSNGHNVITIRHNIPSNSYLFIYQATGYCFTYRFSEMAKLRAILLHFPCTEIYVNELVSYPNLYDTLNIIRELKIAMDAKLVFYLHDYYCICPSETLLNFKKEYCGVPEAEECASCFVNVTPSAEYNDIQTWRKCWGAFLDICDEIVAFSNSSLKIFKEAYGSWHNTVMVPHQVDYMPKLKKTDKSTDTINIGILGAIGISKGSHIIREMLQTIKRESLNVRIVIIGYSDGTIPYSPYLVETGEYEPHDVTALALRYDVDIFFIPSIWPETFSYTTEEVIQMEMPVACFDIGAPAERVAAYAKGLVIDEIDAEIAIKEIIKFIKE